MVGYNGYYGCFYCKLKGEYIKEKNHVYFPNEENNPSKLNERSSQEVEQHAKQVPSIISLDFSTI